MPAATVGHETARIGDGADMLANGDPVVPVLGVQKATTSVRFGLVMSHSEPAST